MANADTTVRRGYLTLHRGGGVSARLNEGGGNVASMLFLL